MATKIYPIKVSVLLRPIGTPQCVVAVDDQIQTLSPIQDTWVKFEFQGRGRKTLTVAHQGKADSDPITAVIVEAVEFDGISRPQFIYQGIYTPNYPKHLLGQRQTLQQNYLSWNGGWTLDFTLPIYTWIHKTENLGWIYD